MSFKGVYFGLTSISTEMFFTLFERYVHCNFQSKMLVALK